MSKVDQYRANAAECRRMAAQEMRKEKHMWRDMSESWLGMIGHALGEDFAAEEREHGTKLPKSASSH